MNRNRSAKYKVHELWGDRVFILDLNGTLSITNDAEAVVRDVVHHLVSNNLTDTLRIIYRDTLGRWDELLHNHGQFSGFAPYTEGLPKPLDPESQGVAPAANSYFPLRACQSLGIHRTKG